MNQPEPNRWIVWLVVLTFHSSICLTASAVEPPFVAGFDRFGQHGDIDPALAGRLLISELSCTACHQSDDPLLTPKFGPRLDGAGSRLHDEWLSRFLANPQQVKPGTTMPAMLDGVPADERPAAIEALVAWLTSQTQTFPEIKGSGARPVPNEFWNHGDARQGQRLFHQIGCVACHAPDDSWETVETKPSPLDDILEQLDPEELEEAGLLSAARRVNSVPLSDLAAKYSRRSLTHFLLAPQNVRPGGRMPDFQLGVVEAADIVAWLLREQSTERATIQPAVKASDELINRGRQLFTDLGCVACHTAAGLDQAPPAAMSLSMLNPDSDRQCVAASRSRLPHYSVDDAQRQAIQLALQSPTERTSLVQAQMTLLQMNCLGCHERDDRGGVGRYRKAYFETVGHIDIGDEGRLPPPLTGVGKKLKQNWVTKVLQGKGSVRAHMRIRMPVFATKSVQALPGQLAAADLTAEPQSAQQVFGETAELAEPGRQLLDTGCVQCHPLRGEAVPGVVGVDLDGVTTRLHPDWFHDFILNPGELKPHTRMPSFFPRGKSQNPNVLDGDTERQIAAMWTYLSGLSRNRLPSKIERARSQNYELKPKDRPVLLRTFMKQAGTHAVAVGWPEGVHFAFDAEQVRLAQAWRGRFLDAQGTWFVRFAPPAAPLGNDILNRPPGPDVAWLQNESEVWPTSAEPRSATSAVFGGYRLDENGAPVFLYSVGSLKIEDRILPDDQSQLRRQLKVLPAAVNGSEGAAGTLWLRAHTAKQLKRLDDGGYQGDNGLQVTVSGELAKAGRVRTHDNGMDWIVPLSAEQSQTVEVQYLW